MNALTLSHASLAFFALAMTIVTPWVKRSPWVWGPFLIIAFALAYLAKIITPIALAPVGGLLILHTLLKGDIKGLARFLLVALTIAISLGLAMHYFPGFHNIPILKNVHFGKNAAPFTLFLNFDKPFIGIFVLALGFPLLRNTQEFGQVMKMAIPLTIAGIIVMILLGLFSGLIQWDPKLPKIFWFFAIENLILVSIIEEAFWRGFVQKELFRWFGERGFLANSACVVFTAFSFAALHYFWIRSIPFLMLVFVAGIIYGSIFQLTKSLEASIFCHWTFNICHFLLFTYPVLASVI